MARVSVCSLMLWFPGAANPRASWELGSDARASLLGPWTLCPLCPHVVTPVRGRVLIASSYKDPSHTRP